MREHREKKFFLNCIVEVVVYVLSHCKFSLAYMIYKAEVLKFFTLKKVKCIYTMYAAIPTNIIIFRIWFLLLVFVVWCNFNSIGGLWIQWILQYQKFPLIQPWMNIFAQLLAHYLLYCHILSVTRSESWMSQGGKKSSFETCKLYSIVDVTIVTLWWLFDSLFLKKVGERQDKGEGRK